MAIKSETIANLLYKQAIHKRIGDLLRDDNDVERATSLFQLYENSEYEFCENEFDFTPIERIMYAILMNCNNGYVDTVCIDEEEWPFFFCSHVNHQQKVGKYKCDFVVDTFICERYTPCTRHQISKIAIECDGHDFHEKTKEQVTNDKKRDRFFVSEGYKVLRFSGSEIYNNFDDIITEITDILESDVNDWEKENKWFFQQK